MDTATQTILSDEQLRCFREQGYLIVRRVFSAYEGTVAVVSVPNSLQW